MKNTKAKNKINKRNKPNKKRKGTTRLHQEYRFVVKTPIIEYINTSFQQPNLKFNIYDLIISNDVFHQIVTSYSQFRLVKLTFFGIPRLMSGQDPSPVWIYLDTDGNNTEFDYAKMPTIQGSKILPTKRFSMTSFSSTGRQNDFKYWYERNDLPMGIYDTLALRLHCASNPTNDITWQFQLGFVLEFRGFKPKDTSNKLLQGEEIVKLTSESQIEKGKDSELQIEDKNQIDEKPESH